MASEPDHEADGLRHGDDKYVQGSSGRSSIRPGVPLPETVLVTHMGDGELLVQTWPDGPGAYLCAEDAGPLRQALEAAFGTDPLGNNRSQS